jgi:hypothetical protein
MASSNRNLPEATNWAMVKYEPARGLKLADPIDRLDIFTGQMALNWAKSTRIFFNLYKSFYTQSSDPAIARTREIGMEFAYRSMLDSYVRFIVAQEAHGSIIALTRTEPNQASQTVEISEGRFGSVTTSVRYPITGSILQEINTIIREHESNNRSGQYNARNARNFIQRGFEDEYIRPIATRIYGLNAMNPRGSGGGEEPIVHRAIVERYLQSTGNIDNLFVEPLPKEITWNKKYQGILRTLSIPPPTDRFVVSDSSLKNTNSLKSIQDILTYAKGLVAKNMAEEEKKQKESESMLDPAKRLLSAGLGVVSSGASSAASSAASYVAKTRPISAVTPFFSSIYDKVSQTYQTLSAIARGEKVKNTTSITQVPEEPKESKEEIKLLSSAIASVANKSAIDLMLQDVESAPSSFVPSMGSVAAGHGSSTYSNQPASFSSASGTGLGYASNIRAANINSSTTSAAVPFPALENKKSTTSENKKSTTTRKGRGRKKAVEEAAAEEALVQEAAAEEAPVEEPKAGSKRGRGSTKETLEKVSKIMGETLQSIPEEEVEKAEEKLEAVAAISKSPPQTPQFHATTVRLNQTTPSSSSSSNPPPLNLNNSGSGAKTPSYGQGGRRKLRKTTKKHRKNKRKTYRRKH